MISKIYIVEIHWVVTSSSFEGNCNLTKTHQNPTPLISSATINTWLNHINSIQQRLPANFSKSITDWVIDEAGQWSDLCLIESVIFCCLPFMLFCFPHTICLCLFHQALLALLPTKSLCFLSIRQSPLLRQCNSVPQFELFYPPPLLSKLSTAFWN